MSTRQDEPTSEPVSLALRREIRTRQLRTGIIALVGGLALGGTGAFSAYTELKGYGRGGSVNLAISAGVLGLVLLVVGLTQIAKAIRGK